jgi:carbon storage regulator
MLVVTRRPGESLIIELPTGERIEVTVVRVKGNQVRLATDAPKHLSVVREELLERLTEEE